MKIAIESFANEHKKNDLCGLIKWIIVSYHYRFTKQELCLLNSYKKHLQLKKYLTIEEYNTYWNLILNKIARSYVPNGINTSISNEIYNDDFINTKKKEIFNKYKRSCLSILF